MRPTPLPPAEAPPPATALRRAAARATAAAGVMAGTAALGGCSASQVYVTALQWQRQACLRIDDRAERSRCLRDLDLSYAEYRRQAGFDGQPQPR